MPNPALPLDQVVIRLVNDSKGHPASLLTDGATFRRHFMEEVQSDTGYGAIPIAAALDAAPDRAEPAPKEQELTSEGASNALPFSEAALPPSMPKTPHWGQDAEQAAYTLASPSGAMVVSHNAFADVSALGSSVVKPAETAVGKTPESNVQSIMFGMRAISDVMAQSGPAQTAPVAQVIPHASTPADTPSAGLPGLAVERGGQAQLTPPIGHLEAVLAASFNQPNVLATVVRPSKAWADIGVGSKLSEALYAGAMTTRAAESIPLTPVLRMLPAVVAQDQMQPFLDFSGVKGIPGDLERWAEGFPVSPLTSSASGITAQHAILPTAQSSAVQVAHAIATTNSDRFEITLSPEELGRVRIQVHQTDVGLQVLISGERPETLDLLRKNIALLSRALSDLGFESASFHFGEQGRDQGRGPKGALVSSTKGLEDVSLPDMSVPPRPTQSSGLDLRI